MASSKAFKDVGFFSETFVFSMDQRFSMGFKSAELPGHPSSRLNLWVVNQFFTILQVCADAERCQFQTSNFVMLCIDIWFLLNNVLCLAFIQCTTMFNGSQNIKSMEVEVNGSQSQSFEFQTLLQLSARGYWHFQRCELQNWRRKCVLRSSAYGRPIFLIE